MKFDAVDTVTNRTWFDGECDGEEITSITPKVGIAKVLLNRAGDPTSLSALSSKFPRLQIGLDEESVGEGEIVKLDPVRKQVFGWAYTSHDPDGNVIVDHSGEYVESVEVLEKAAYGYMLQSRVGSADHIGSVIGLDQPLQKSTMIESMVFTPEKLRAMNIPDGTIPQGAWWVGFQVHDDQTWEGVEKGHYKMFSIHGRGRKKTHSEGES